MFDLGEVELTIESYRIPWLIWIQLIVLFLLFLILFCFALLPTDPNHDATTAVATTSSTSNNDIQQIDHKQPLPNDHDSTPILVTNHSQGGQNLSIKGEIATSSSMRREEITEGEASSMNFHPCHYFQLATVAFLKCFGLDSSSDSPSTRTHLKRKES